MHCGDRWPVFSGAFRRPDPRVVERPSTTSVPRIGWAQSLSLAGMQTWQDMRLAE